MIPDTLRDLERLERILAQRRGDTNPELPLTIEGRISKQSDVAVRETLCEAAASLLPWVRIWSALRAWYLRIAKRSSMLCEIGAVARKLASTLHRMWVSEADFHVGFGAKVTQRLRLKPAQ